MSAGQPVGGPLERRIAAVLRAGTYSAVGLVAFGAVLMLAAGRSPLDVAPVIDPARLVAEITAFHPAGWIWLGVLVVLATPVARVVTALVGYVRAGEREMAVVAAAILAVILLGVVAGILAPETRG